MLNHWALQHLYQESAAPYEDTTIDINEYEWIFQGVVRMDLY